MSPPSQSAGFLNKVTFLAPTFCLRTYWHAMLSASGVCTQLGWRGSRGCRGRVLAKSQRHPAGRGNRPTPGPGPSPGTRSLAGTQSTCGNVVLSSGGCTWSRASRRAHLPHPRGGRVLAQRTFQAAPGKSAALGMTRGERAQLQARRAGRAPSDGRCGAAAAGPVWSAQELRGPD